VKNYVDKNLPSLKTHHNPTTQEIICNNKFINWINILYTQRQQKKKKKKQTNKKKNKKKKEEKSNNLAEKYVWSMWLFRHVAPQEYSPKPTFFQNDMGFSRMTKRQQLYHSRVAMLREIKKVYENVKREVTHAYISDCGFDEIFPVGQVKVGVFVVNLKNKNKIKNNDISIHCTRYKIFCKLCKTCAHILLMSAKLFSN
jgi:hypothetical protein